MSQIEKLLQKIENSPKNVSFETIKKLLENAGYECYNSGSSHFQFRKSGFDTLTIPFKRPVKAVYVKKVVQILKEQK